MPSARRHLVGSTIDIMGNLNMRVYLKNKLRKFDGYRRQKMLFLESIMYQIIKNDTALVTTLIENAQVKHVLIVRNNKRIGNILFLIPFVRETLLAYPNAKVDIMLSQPWQGQFFEGMGIDNIHYSHFSYTGLFKWFKVIKHLNKLNVDLIIAPNCCASDAINVAMIASKNKLSTYNEMTKLAFPHAIKCTSPRPHTAHGGLSLLEASGYTLSQQANHHLSFSNEEVNQGREQSSQYISNNAVNMVFFRGARGIKLLQPNQWENILKKFESALDKPINWIEILSPDISAPLRANTKTFASKNMRSLGAFLRHFDGFICCDTGPLHLADASDVKCIGLYTHTDPETFGLLGKNSFHITDIHHFNVQEIGLKLGFIGADKQ